MTRRAVLAVPFALIAGAAIARLAVGPGWGLLPLMVVGPALAAALGGLAYTLTAGAAAGTASVLSGVNLAHTTPNEHEVVVALLATVGVTAFGMLAARSRERRGRELAEVKVVAEVAQRVLLRPVPPRVDSVRMADRYLSASHGAQVGGDLYDVAPDPDRIRLIIGDAEGKGLPAVRSAAGVTGVFREAAHEEASLAAIVARIEASLARELGAEEFVTAIVGEIIAGEDKIELISCGHPAPLLLGTGPPRFADPGPSGLPLGLSDLAVTVRTPFTIGFGPGDEVLFYTDGVSEARNKAGAFFPLARCASVAAGHDPSTLVDRLSDEITRYVGHAPEDDMALLLVYKDAA